MSDWTKKAEKFAKVRAQILQVLSGSSVPLDMGQIMQRFKLKFHYLPYLERRFYELMETQQILRIDGAIPRYRVLTLREREEIIARDENLVLKQIQENAGFWGSDRAKRKTMEKYLREKGVDRPGKILDRMIGDGKVLSLPKGYITIQGGI